MSSSSLDIYSPHDKQSVERINLTDEAHLCNPQRLDDPVQATLPITDVCSDNYAALAAFTNLSELSLSHTWLCEHSPSPAGQRTRPLPDFSQGVLRGVAGRLRKVWLSKCGLCEQCLEKIRLDLLENVTYLNLVCNRLLDFPLVVTSLKKLRELHVSANVDMCPAKTEAKLRQLEAEGQLPVMHHLEVFASSFCDLQDYSGHLFKLMPNVNTLQLSNCALSQVPAAVLDLVRRELLRHLEVQNNYLSFLPAEIAKRRPTSQCMVNVNDNRLGNKNELHVASPVVECTGQRDADAWSECTDRIAVPEQETCSNRDGNSNIAPAVAPEAVCQDAGPGTESTQSGEDSNDGNEKVHTSVEETRPTGRESSSSPPGHSGTQRQRSGTPSLGQTLMTVWHILLFGMYDHAMTCDGETYIDDEGSSDADADDCDHSQHTDFFSFIGFHRNPGGAGGDGSGQCSARYSIPGRKGLLDFLRRAHRQFARRQHRQTHGDYAEASVGHLPEESGSLGELSSASNLPRWTASRSSYARHLDTGQPSHS